MQRSQNSDTTTSTTTPNAPKSYNPKLVESKFYKICEERGYFEIDGNKHLWDKTPQSFCIMMPPPNVTGVLHIGHALTFTLQDIITRFKRMQGFKSLYQPGLDHAGIATQNIVQKQLLESGTSKEELGREGFIKKVWEWKEKSGGAILSQMRHLGITPAWSRLRFTMDSGLQNAVKKAFIAWHNQGLIVRDNYMVNWCVSDGAISDIEVEYEEQRGKLYYLRYPIVDSKQVLIVATTRPETFFGDSAVMVNPNDERYKDVIGKSVMLPLLERQIPIIADEFVDMGFGTGCVKVTPAHDINDYEVGKRHNLPFITIFDSKGILNEKADSFSGLDRLKARESIIEALQEKGFVEKIEDYTNKVGKCYRCGNIIEPYISKQWFVKKEVATNAINRVNSGELAFFPKQWINNYNAWMKELKDWCISRQLWWGHRIPVWYCECGAVVASMHDNPTCKHCGKTITKQDSDVLDTWFSSGLWAFSTLGWGNALESAESSADSKSAHKANADSKSASAEGFMMRNQSFQASVLEATSSGSADAHERRIFDLSHKANAKLYNDSDLKEFYPNNLLITGFDILFFWVARMLLSGESLLNALPFKDVYLHALVRDSEGQKMSKSKGNVIDPLEMIEAYGADTLRFTLAILCIQGRDVKLSTQALDTYKNFTNKLFNATQFLKMYLGQLGGEAALAKGFGEADSTTFNTPLGKYMLARLNVATKEVIEALESYRFEQGASVLYRFLWGEFCDWGIELAKVDKEAIYELGAVFKEAMKLLHPYMPFISDYLWHELSGSDIERSDSIMISRYPSIKALESSAKQLCKDFELIQDVIISIRRLKAMLELGNAPISQVSIKLNASVDSAMLERFVCKLAKVEALNIVDSKIEGAVCDVSSFCECYIRLENIDISAITTRLNNQKQKLEKDIAKLESMLGNKQFIANAPDSVVAQNKSALDEARQKYAKISQELDALTK